ncbi:MAG: dockerin type I repeat-containing protein [Planctomycetota bacterium]
MLRLTTLASLLLLSIASTALVAQDCVPVQTDTLRIAERNGRFIVEDGRRSSFLAGQSREEAERAIEIAQHYGMDQMCFVGRPNPSMVYWLVDGAAPQGSLTGEDCIGLNPTTASVEFTGGEWKLVDGSSWLLGFGNSQEEAEEALSIIREHSFDRLCFVGRPNPLMTYWKASCAPPQLTGTELSTTTAVINGEQFDFQVAYENNCGGRVSIQNWIEQGETRRAAGGWSDECTGDCDFSSETGVMDADTVAGNGKFTPGPAVFVTQLIQNGQIRDSHRVPLTLVEDCPATISLVHFTSTRPTIGGESLPYIVQVRNRCGGELTVRSWIEQPGGIRREAGSLTMECDGSCTFPTEFEANNNNAGAGSFRPGMAQLSIQLRRGAEILHSTQARITLAASEEPIYFLRGDVDGSGNIDITDGVATLNWLFQGGDDPGCMAAADFNNNGTVNLSDAIRCFSFLFLGGPQPVAPYPECGEAPEGNQASCEEPHNCI